MSHNVSVFKGVETAYRNWEEREEISGVEGRWSQTDKNETEEHRNKKIISVFVQTLNK